MKFNANVKLNENGEFVLANIERGSSLPTPSSSVNGTLFFNTADNEFYLFQNGAWNIIGSGTLVQALNDLSNVSVTTPSSGQVLIYDGTSNFVNKNIQYKYQYTGTGTTVHVITHNLNQSVVSVQCYDDSTSPSRVFIPDLVESNSVNQCTVTINEDIPVTIIVTGFAQSVEETTKTLNAALADEGITSARFVLDATQADSYGGSGTTVTDLLGNHNYTLDGATTFNGTVGSTSAYFRSTSQVGGWVPSPTTTTWSNNLHRAGGKWSSITIIRSVVSANGYAHVLCTWNNIAGQIGMAQAIITSPTSGITGEQATCSGPGGRTYGVRRTPTTPGGTQWCVIISSYGDNTPQFTQINGVTVPSGIIYPTTGGYAQTPTTPITTETANVPYVSPSPSAPSGALYILGLPGANGNTTTVDLKCISVLDDVITPEQATAIYNSIKDRYL